MRQSAADVVLTNGGLYLKRRDQANRLARASTGPASLAVATPARVGLTRHASAPSRPVRRPLNLGEEGALIDRQVTGRELAHRANFEVLVGSASFADRGEYLEQFDISLRTMKFHMKLYLQEARSWTGEAVAKALDSKHFRTIKL